jgi:hypothetical protein
VAENYEVGHLKQLTTQLYGEGPHFPQEEAQWKILENPSDAINARVSNLIRNITACITDYRSWAWATVSAWSIHSCSFCIPCLPSTSPSLKP